MASEMMKAPHRGNGGDLRKIQSGRADIPETNLAALQAQYLSEVFALPGSTAAVLAELAFGGAA